MSENLIKSFLTKIYQKAKKLEKTIVYPEGTEERILKATEAVLKENLANLILVGEEKVIKEKASSLGLKIDWQKVNIIDQYKSKLTEKFAKEFFKLRKHKGISLEDAQKKVLDMNYFGTMLVHMGMADGMITGTTYSTAESIRPALQIIKTQEKFHKVSGIFLMLMEDRLMFFADTAITIGPNSHDLKDIAIDTAETAQKFGIEPKIAMLSFSTYGSADHPNVDKVKEAVGLIKNERPDLLVDGELQVDSAIIPEVAKRKCPNSPLKGEANVLIFPDLEAANIAYKLVERLAKARAVGPILQGLKKPINDLSRGCHFQDIVDLTAFTACEAE